MTGESAASHEGTYLEPDERDGEVLTMTRHDLRIIVNVLLDALVLRLEVERLRDHVRLDTITPEELAR